MLIRYKGFELEFAMTHIYIKISAWEYWKQWKGTDIN